MVLTFMDERRKRIEKARAEGIAEGIVKGRAEGRSEGIVEGLGQANAAWSEWNRRREEALERGERFDEPPPNVNGR